MLQSGRRSPFCSSAPGCSFPEIMTQVEWSWWRRAAVQLNQVTRRWADVFSLRRKINAVLNA